jgi:hypothetical protein
VNIKLQYLKKSKEIGAWALKYGTDLRMWNIIAPEGHALYPYHHSTRTVEGLKELRIIR